MGSKSQTDLAIIGGGLAGSLLALGLAHRHPKLKVHIYEKSDRLCGNHTWCLHDHDIPDDIRPWFLNSLDKSWDGYDVHFPKYSRSLKGQYHSIKSESLAQKVMTRFPEKVHLNTPVDLENSRLEAPLVIQTTGWPKSSGPNQRLGWQKFFGIEVELEAPHHLTRPILKDVLQKQSDGYRFIYSLPFSATQVLIEDTYYSNSSELDPKALKAGLFDYAAQKGWKIKSVLREEIGKLPLYLDLPKAPPSRSLKLGAASEFLNPVTGYTLPMTLQTIAAVLNLKEITAEALRETLAAVENKYRTNLRYLTWLNRMMFLAAEPEKRYQILERFYQLNEDLIGRFYSGNLKTRDQFRILMGKPPVPVFRAIRALLSSQ